MKSIYLFCTNPLVYLTEAPILLLLWIAISYNSLSTEIFKYYPLIIFLSLAVVFIMVYFFRVISISTDEIRYHGIFSSRDSAFIAENKSLVISLKRRHRLGLELYGDAGEEPAFEWMKSEDVTHRDICLFRGKAFGGKRSAKRILTYFSLPEEEITKAFSEGYTFENDAIRVESYTKNEIFEIKIKFKITIV